MGKRELVALLSLSSWYLVIVVWLFLEVPWVCLHFVIVIILTISEPLSLLGSLNLVAYFTIYIYLIEHSPDSFGGNAGANTGK